MRFTLASNSREKEETEKEKIAFPDQVFLCAYGYICVCLKPNRREAYNNNKKKTEEKNRTEKRRSRSRRIRKKEEQTTFDIENVRIRTIVGCHSKYDAIYT